MQSKIAFNKDTWRAEISNRDFGIGDDVGVSAKKVQCFFRDLGGLHSTLDNVSPTVTKSKLAQPPLGVGHVFTSSTVN